MASCSSSASRSVSPASRSIWSSDVDRRPRDGAPSCVTTHRTSPQCVDNIVVLGETHLRRLLKSYSRYYNKVRTHRSLDKDAPFSRPVQRAGSITSHALLGGLHHHYVRV